MQTRRPAALLLALAVAVVTGCAALVGMLWGFGLKCDDTCGTPPPWRRDENAWQWSALGWLGIGAFAFAVLFVVALAARRLIAASVIAVVWTGLAAWYIVLFDDSGLTSNAHRGWIGLAMIVVALVAAIRLTPHRT
jgi:hypothetical protein